MFLSSMTLYFVGCHTKISSMETTSLVHNTVELITQLETMCTVHVQAGEVKSGSKDRLNGVTWRWEISL